MLNIFKKKTKKVENEVIFKDLDKLNEQLMKTNEEMMRDLLGDQDAYNAWELERA